MLWKRVVFICLVLALLLGIGAPARGEAALPIRVLLDGRALSFDTPPQMVQGRVLVPLRGIFEALGANLQ